MTVEQFDVVVVGGGTAGVPAAVQAGRAGAKTLLVEKYGMLGGTVTAGGVHFPSAFAAWGKQIIAGIGWDLVRRCLEESGQPLPDFTEDLKARGYRHIHVDLPLFSLLCCEVVEDAGVTTLMHAMPASIRRQQDGWEVSLATKSGLRTIQTRTLIDCTADADVVAMAGYERRIPDDVQPATLIYRLGGYDVESLDIETIVQAYDREVEAGRLEYIDVGWTTTYASLEHWLRARGGNSSHVRAPGAHTSEGKTSLEFRSRQVLLRVLRFLRTQPGLENLHIEWICPECGVRETAVIAGETTVTREEYLNGRLYDDAVCYAFYPVDIHVLDDRRAAHEFLAEGVVPTVPRGALVPAGSENLLAAGRCISSDRAANSALRIEAACMATGQAVGALAALASRDGVSTAAVSNEALRELLRQHGAIVPEPAAVDGA